MRQRRALLRALRARPRPDRQAHDQGRDADQRDRAAPAGRRPRHRRHGRAGVRRGACAVRPARPGRALGAGRRRLSALAARRRRPDRRRRGAVDGQPARGDSSSPTSTRRRSNRSARRSSAIRAFATASTSASWKSSRATASACACSSAAPAKRWPAAPAPARRSSPASASACSTAGRGRGARRHADDRMGRRRRAGADDRPGDDGLRGRDRTVITTAGTSSMGIQGITETDIANYLANSPGFFERHAELLGLGAADQPARPARGVAAGAADGNAARQDQGPRAEDHRDDPARPGQRRGRRQAAPLDPGADADRERRRPARRAGARAARPVPDPAGRDPRLGRRRRRSRRSTSRSRSATTSRSSRAA